MQKNRLYIPGMKHCIFLLLLLSSLVTFGQSQEGSVPSADSVVVGETQSVAPPGEETGQDDDKGYFTKQLFPPDSNSVELKTVRPGYIDSLKQLDAFWYADSAFNKNGTAVNAEKGSKEKVNNKKSSIKQKEEEEKEDTGSSGLRLPRWLDTFIWILLGGIFVGLLTWYLLSSNIIVFGKRKSKLDGTGQHEEEMPEDIFSIPYERELQKALANKNFRLATRLLFLQLLRQMADRNIIQYKQERTNFDYLSQLYRTSYYEPFMKVARNYEYAWYGQFEVNEEAFAVIKKDTEQLQSKFY